MIILFLTLLPIRVPKFKKNDLPSRICQNDVYKMVRVAAEEVFFLLLANALIFSNIRAEFKIIKMWEKGDKFSPV